MNAQELMKQGGTGGALSYFLLTGATEWLGLLPPIPEGAYLPMIAAGGAILTAVFRLAGLGSDKPVPPAPDV